MKINSKVVWSNLIILTGLLLDWIIPHISDYQSVLSPKMYAWLVIVMPIINIIFRVIRPSIVPIEMVKKDDAN